MTATMIDIETLSFRYRDRSPIFDSFSLAIHKGEAWSIIGPSGCGKTTLLYLMAGLNRPEAGVIRVAGAPIERPRPRTGLVLQDHGLLPWATVEENTKLGFKIRGFYGPDGKHSPEDAQKDPEAEGALTRHWLSWLGIDHLREKYPAELSRGQRQRAAIARTLVLSPDLLLMDEPFSALDAPIREELQRVMNRFHRETGLTSLTVTHDIEEAVVLGEKILVLSDTVNRAPTIVDNPHAGDPDLRMSKKFMEQCGTLRALIESPSRKEKA
ncbi:ABC transporter ATP-binding protein [Desulfoluna spongiiphila]|uniref:ABC transporter ATP-binding protein n=1 Tax=Desulfoluna spongiiphila TaxID=419481 RepID=UPI00125F1220|nr:ATP-binding cassette domain-containing protein [Desulfoluna spongiiphila]